MEKRLILAAVLSLLVIALYPFILKRMGPPQPQKVTKLDKKAEEPPSLQPLQRGPFVMERGEEVEAIVDTPLYRATISSLGGGIKGFSLKRYKESLKSKENVEMVSTRDKGLYPFQLFDSEGRPIRLAPLAKELDLKEREKGVLTLKGKAGGIGIEERLHFSGSSYEIRAELFVRNRSDREVKERITISLFKSLKNIPKGRYAYGGPVVYTEKGIVTEKVNKLALKTYPSVRWAGVEDKYFLFALIPSEKGKARVGKVDEDTVFATLELPLSIPPQGSKDYKITAYAGPKEVDILEAFGVGLEDTVNFGIFSILSKPLLIVLKVFYRYIGNYGIAIILLTLIIKILFYPLTLQSLRSMKEMQKIQPQIAAIKEKYKKDKERMNRELMELYKRSKINPLGGCLPILLQIPVFIALYNVLLLSIELRHAPFILWIKDLSAKDPYYITPILMGVSMFIQQKMSPTSMDPQQAKLLLIMPIVFTFLFLNFPSGLVLYWLTNNILSIAQQYYIQKRV